MGGRHSSDEEARVDLDLTPASLRRLDLLASLEDAQLAELARGARRLSLADGQSLFDRESSADRFYRVNRGRIVLGRRAVDGSEAVMAIVGPGEVISEGLVSGDEPRHAVDARSVGSSEVTSFDAATLRRFLGGSVPLCLAVMDTLLRRERRLMDSVERLALQSATQRLGGFLLDALEARKDPSARGPLRVRPGVPKGVLASRLGMRPETLSRTLAKLEAGGHVREEKGTFLVADPDALAAYLGCFCAKLPAATRVSRAAGAGETSPQGACASRVAKSEATSRSIPGASLGRSISASSK